MEEFNYESTNINALWLQNIYENLKNLEIYERFAREGCVSVIEYAQIQVPIEKKEIYLVDLEYKNLRFIITEISLLLTDLTPVINKESLQKYREQINNMSSLVENRKLFVEDIYSAIRKEIIKSKKTSLFIETLKFLTELRTDIIKSIAHLLYVSEPDQSQKPWKRA